MHDEVQESEGAEPGIRLDHIEGVPVEIEKSKKHHHHHHHKQESYHSEAGHSGGLPSDLKEAQLHSVPEHTAIPGFTGVSGKDKPGAMFAPTVSAHGKVGVFDSIDQCCVSLMYAKQFLCGLDFKKMVCSAFKKENFNYLYAHIAYVSFTALISAVIMWALHFNHPVDLNFADALFVSMSSNTVTGLMSVQKYNLSCLTSTRWTLQLFVLECKLYHFFKLF